VLVIPLAAEIPGDSPREILFKEDPFGKVFGDEGIFWEVCQGGPADDPPGITCYCQTWSYPR
jgi:hypothetical protein